MTKPPPPPPDPPPVPVPAGPIHYTCRTCGQNFDSMAAFWFTPHVGCTVKALTDRRA